MTPSPTVRRAGHASRLTVVLVLLLIATACVSPARTAEQYRAKASSALEAAGSEVATGALVTSQRLDERATRAYADEVVTAAETAAGSIASTFGTVQPPQASPDALRDDVSRLLQDAQDALSAARIALRRDDRPAMLEARDELAGVSADLEAGLEALG